MTWFVFLFSPYVLNITSDPSSSVIFAGRSCRLKFSQYISTNLNCKVVFCEYRLSRCLAGHTIWADISWVPLHNLLSSRALQPTFKHKGYYDEFPPTSQNQALPVAMKPYFLFRVLFAYGSCWFSNLRALCFLVGLFNLAYFCVHRMRSHLQSTIFWICAMDKLKGLGVHIYRTTATNHPMASSSAATNVTCATWHMLGLSDKNRSNGNFSPCLPLSLRVPPEGQQERIKQWELPSIYRHWSPLVSLT